MDAIENYFSNSSKVISSLNKDLEIIKDISKEIFKLNKNNGKIMIAGNGGSCADAEHFAGELLCTFKDRDRKGFSAVSLANNPSAITAWSNDFGFETFFSRQVSSLGKSGDILFLISTGGGNIENKASMNLVYAAEVAKKNNIRVFTLAGKGGGILKEISDYAVVVESSITSHIQEAHIAIIHLICEFLDEFDISLRSSND